MTEKDFFKGRQWRMGRNKQFLCIFIILIVTDMIPYGTKRFKQWQEEHSGIPDISSCISVNNDHYLTVVANAGEIKDKEEFAREVIHMCQQNSFRSIRFSTDIDGYPSKLNITVYLNRKDIEGNEPVCKIEFMTDDYNEDYDIKNDADKFQLYLNGNKIKF